MKLDRRAVILAQVMFLSILRLSAQTTKVVRDLRSRTAVNIEKEISSKVAIYGETEIGFEHNLSQFEEFHGEIGLQYDVNKLIDLGAKYRVLKDRKKYTESFEITNVYALSAEVDYRFRNVSGNWRLQYQNVDEEDVELYSKKRCHNIIRNRLKLKKHIFGTTITPYFSSELYIRFARRMVDAHKVKFVYGLCFDLRRGHEFDTYLRFDNELAPDFPYRYYTLGAVYKFSF